MMRAAHNNPDMKEKQRYLEARKRIEVVCINNPNIDVFII